MVSQSFLNIKFHHTDHLSWISDISNCMLEILSLIWGQEFRAVRNVF